MEPPQSSAINRRDHGFALLGRINRWFAAGAVAAAGGLSLLAAHSFHGYTAAPASAPASAGGGSSAPSGVAASGTSAPSSSPASSPAPTAAPAPAPQAVVSGGS